MLVSAALKIHMSESAHDAVKAFPEFITQCRGETFVKVSLVYSGIFHSTSHHSWAFFASAGLRLWRPWCTRKNEAPVGQGFGEGVSSSPGMRVRGVNPGKNLKFETQFGAIWCILSRNWWLSSFPPLWTKTLPIQWYWHSGPSPGEE